MAENGKTRAVAVRRSRSNNSAAKPLNSSTSKHPVTRHTSHVTGCVTVKRSAVHGRGVFARKLFRKGQRIIEYTGRRVLWADVPDELDDPRMYFFAIGDGKWVIDPSVKGNEARFINHSCDPNCEIRETRRRIFIHALRNIGPGEELFYDYHLETDPDVPRTKEIEAEAPCHCGARNCRGTLLAAAKAAK